jgi:tRNA uridine 5-carboxymethylaminomethyl modification enzyme
VDEPYRLFTSRSEFRLTVRQDNAIERLSPIAIELGIYSERERQVVSQRCAADRDARRLAEETSIRPEQAAPILSDVDSNALVHSVKIAELARRQNISLASLFDAVGVGQDLDPAAVLSTELEIKYAGYFDRERIQADRIRRMGEFALPEDLDYTGMASLTFEARHKLTAIRPRSLAQVSRIPGVSPSDIQNLVMEVERHHRRGVVK